MRRLLFFGLLCVTLLFYSQFEPTYDFSHFVGNIVKALKLCPVKVVSVQGNIELRSHFGARSFCHYQVLMKLRSSTALETFRDIT